MTSTLEGLKQRIKCRWRIAQAVRARSLAEPPSTAEFEQLVGHQLAHWRNHPPATGERAVQLLHQLNRSVETVRVFSIRGRRLRVWRKPDPAAGQANEATAEAVRQMAHRRLAYYQTFIGFVLSRAPSGLHLDFALDLSDLACSHEEVPVFCFQKPRGTANVLLPDVDFFHEKWYLKDHDPLRYEDKSISACFVGASTGGDLTLEAVERDALPRLRAAKHFFGNPAVFFRIAKAVQCTSEEARQALQRKPYFCAPVGWREQLEHRFILSMDGNGAACSRLVKGLRSNGVVIKYDSEHELYYFPALRAGQHYLPAQADEDVAALVQAEQAEPGRFREVAESGQQFARKYLQPGSVITYMQHLLAGYGRLMESAARAR